MISICPLFSLFKWINLKKNMFHELLVLATHYSSGWTISHKNKFPKNSIQEENLYSILGSAIAFLN